VHAYRPNHYEALGIPRDADAETIRAAYRTQAKELHPDLSEGSSNEAFLRLQEAYDVLRDPERRASYDDTLAREAAMAGAARQAAIRPIPRTPRAPPAMPPRARSRLRRLAPYLIPLGLVVIVTGGIVGWPLLFEPEPEPIIIVKVDRDGGRRPALPADPGILTKEVDRGVQAQIERVEAAKKRMAEQLSELDAHKPSANGAPTKPPAMKAARVQCTGRGTNIVMTRDKDSAKVSYDNGPPVQPRISDLGTGTVLVSRFESSNKIAIGFTKGDRTTQLLLFDEVGKVLQTFPVDCTAAAF
jgi:DnaJ-like protein